MEQGNVKEHWPAAGAGYQRSGTNQGVLSIRKVKLFLDITIIINNLMIISLLSYTFAN